MRTMLFVLAAVSAAGLADASQLIALGQSPEAAQTAPGNRPDSFVVVDPICAFDGSYCQAPTPDGQELAVGALAEAATPQEAACPAPQPAEPAANEASPEAAGGHEGS